MREALRLLEERDLVGEAQLGVLRAEVHRGVKHLDAGRGERLDVAAIKKRGREPQSRARKG